jgi:hypothetical protein
MQSLTHVEEGGKLERRVVERIMMSCEEEM